MARLNTVHITVLEARGLPPAAAYLTAQCSGQKVKLANLDKGRVAVESGGSLVGTESAEAVWLTVYDDGVAFDSALGNCMLLLTTLDLQARPYEGWLPFLTLKGEVAGRVAVQIFGDWSESVSVTVLRATIADRVDCPEPYVEVRLRGVRNRTTVRQVGRTPVWEEQFRFFVGSRDRLCVSLFASPGSLDDRHGTAEVLGIDALKRRGETLWVPILNKAGSETARVLMAFAEDPWEQHLPVRILQAKGLAAGDTRGTSDLYIKGKCGPLELRTSVKPNTVDAVWDEEFLLAGVKHVDALHLEVKDKDILWDESLGEAFIPVSELLAHSGEQVWVDLSGTNGRHNGRLLLWIQPPPGAVYPDTLTHKRLLSYEDWDLAFVKPQDGTRVRPTSDPASPPAIMDRADGQRIPAITYVGSAPPAPVYTPDARPLDSTKTRGGYDPARDYRHRT